MVAVRWRLALVYLFQTMMSALSFALVGATNPIALAMGQRMAPESASIISGILIGMAWAVASLSIGLVAYLATLPALGVPGALGLIGITGVLTACFVPIHAASSTPYSTVFSTGAASAKSIETD